jgi:integrase
MTRFCWIAGAIRAIFGGMSKPYLLNPKWDPKHNAWRLNLPWTISPSGKRERHLFKQKHEALAEANKIRTIHRDYGRSFNLLPFNRHNEAVECWKILDDLYNGNAPWGSLRRIVLRESKAIKERQTSITLGALFDSYVDKLKRMHRAENYVKGYHYLRGYMDFWLETKVSDLTAGNIKFSLGKLPSGHFNSNLRLLRAVLGHGVKLGYLKSNPTLNLEFVHRERVEVKPLPNAIVRGMLTDAATSKRLEMLPYLALGFGTGCREGELSKLVWSDVVLEEKRLLIRASVSKTRNSRYVPILGCFPEWIRLYLDKIPNKPTPDERIMRSFTLSKIRDARAANYKAAGGIGTEPPNSKRRTCASCHRAFYEDDPKLSHQLGHTNIKQSQEYAGAATRQQATEYFDIRP